MKHLHEQGSMWRVALHVLEVQEVLAPLGHCLQVWEELKELCELVLEGRKRRGS